MSSTGGLGEWSGICEEWTSPRPQRLYLEGGTSITSPKLRLRCARNTVRWSLELGSEGADGEQRVSTRSQWVIIGWDKAPRRDRVQGQRIRWQRTSLDTVSQGKVSLGGGNGADHNYKSWLWNLGLTPVLEVTRVHTHSSQTWRCGERTHHTGGRDKAGNPGTHLSYKPDSKGLAASSIIT